MSLTRRELLENSMLATAAAAAASLSGKSLLAAEESSTARRVAANDKIHIAVVGVNGQGGQHVSELLKNPDVKLVAICDVDPAAYAKQVVKFSDKRKAEPDFKDPVYVSDIRKLLEMKELDAVTIATPNHWHALAAIWAIQAGKDVYCEKPVSHNVSEGRRIVEFARKHNKIVQTGTQSRSMVGMRKTIEYVQSGKIGKVNFARGLCFKLRKSIGKSTTPVKLPAGLDFDLWAGPAAKELPVRSRLHYDWHWFWDTGNGDLGNQGIHEMDKLRWGLSKSGLPSKIFSLGGRLGYEDDGQTANTQVCFYDWGDAQAVFEVRGLDSTAVLGAKIGNIWYGSNGYVVSTNYVSGTAFDLEGNAVESWKGGEYQAHFANFVKAVRSRKPSDLNADIEEGHVSSAMCHLGNISYRLGSETTFAEAAAKLSHDGFGGDKLKETIEATGEHLKTHKLDLATLKVRSGSVVNLDPKTETTDCPDCNKMLTRQYRAPYVVPTSV